MSPSGPEVITATSLCPGLATGPVLALAEPLSLWGGSDPHTGRIIDGHHPQHGAGLAGRVLVMEASRGSSSSSAVLAEQIRAGVGPAAIVVAHRDAIVALGVLVAAELYSIEVPVVAVDPSDLRRLRTGMKASVEAKGQLGEVRVSAGL